MASSFQCSPSSAFTATNANFDSCYDLLGLDRGDQCSQELYSPYHACDQGEPIHVFQSSSPSICMENIASFHSPVYNGSYSGLPTGSNISYPMVPFPFLAEFGLEPGFIRKRNERERMRVRNVNEGYARLRDHLPLEPSEKRLSKVETLRSAIKYIKYLEELLKESSSSEKDSGKGKPERGQKKSFETNNSVDEDECVEID